MKNEWARMTWVEIALALEKRPVVLVPLGSVEQHGPHTPVGDYLASEVVAKMTAERTDSLYIPTVPYGYSENHHGFPGTLTYRAETLLLTLEDITDCLLEVGVDHIVWLCGHGGNVPIIEQHARNLLRKGVIRTACIDLWRMLTPEFSKSLYGDAPTGHGSEPIGSVMRFVAPGADRPDLWALPSKAMFKGLPAKGSQVTLNGHMFHIYPSSYDTSDIGVIGDPSLASEERGKKIIDFVVDVCVDIVEWFKAMDTRVDNVQLDVAKALKGQGVSGRGNN